MHDPLTVAHVIIRPWPQRTSFSATGSRDDGVRWKIRHHHDCGSWCAEDPPHREGAFPWWKPSSYSRFWRAAGRELYWPALVTVWHREPHGRDGLTECSRRVQRRDGTWHHTRGWRWHVHHFKLQIHPAQDLRRALLTRCAWCGGRSRKGDPVNISHQWDGPRGRWWKGEPGLFHHDCSAVQHSHAKCFCTVPVLRHGDYGQCEVCGGHRAWHQEPDDADRLLAALPKGSRITADVRPAVEAAWAERRRQREASAS
jgi:hypothetical protein